MLVSVCRNKTRSFKICDNKSLWHLPTIPEMVIVDSSGLVERLSLGSMEGICHFFSWKLKAFESGNERNVLLEETGACSDSHSKVGYLSFQNYFIMQPRKKERVFSDICSRYPILFQLVIGWRRTASQKHLKKCLTMNLLKRKRKNIISSSLNVELKKDQIIKRRHTHTLKNDTIKKTDKKHYESSF
jgi:hypothetical protein